MFHRFAISLAFVVTIGCDVDEEAVGIDEPSQADLEAIADGPPSEANYEVFGLTSASHPQFADGWRRVCASSLTLRNAPGGNTLGTLYNGYWFYKNGTSGSWSSGYSNELGTWGWVLSQYLC